jgi:hypothetical protein
MRTIGKRVATLRRKAKDRQGVQLVQGEPGQKLADGPHFLELNRALTAGGPGGPSFFDQIAIRATEREHEYDEHAEAQTASREANHLDPLDPMEPLSNYNGLQAPPTWTPCGLPGPLPYHWTDDRAWICEVGDAPDEAAKLAVLTTWVKSAGGRVADGTAYLAPLRPHQQRRLAELELRRMLLQHRLKVAET